MLRAAARLAAPRCPAALGMARRMQSSTPSYTERMNATGRPLSPHVTIYAFPAGALSSITVRITGMLLCAGEEPSASRRLRAWPRGLLDIARGACLAGRRAELPRSSRDPDCASSPQALPASPAFRCSRVRRRSPQRCSTWPNRRLPRSSNSPLPGRWSTTFVAPSAMPSGTTRCLASQIRRCACPATRSSASRPPCPWRQPASLYLPRRRRSETMVRVTDGMALAWRLETKWGAATRAGRSAACDMYPATLCAQPTLKRCRTCTAYLVHRLGVLPSLAHRAA